MSLDPELLAAIGPRVRLSPFFDRTAAAGLHSVTCYNHMWLPMSYGDPDAEYERLTTGVSMWDVAAQRHIQVAGADADAVAQLVTVVDTSAVGVGSAAYAPMVDHDGRLVNDPVLLHVGEREWRFSVADSDIRLWVDATARAHALDCMVTELDTATLAIQGPKAMEVMDALGLGSASDLESFEFRSMRLDELDLRVCRSGWSTQGGFEIFLDDPTGAERLWDLVADAGEHVGIGPGAPNPSERIENFLLSYGTDTGYDADPYELGLDDVVDLSCGDFVGRAALEEIASHAPARRLRGLLLDGAKIGPLARPLVVESSGESVGRLRAAAWSPRFERNLGIALISAAIDVGGTIEVVGHDDVEQGVVVDLPFDDGNGTEWPSQ
ncbi:glycine cleavage T C-terminal barrel domain-containing protein [Ilumatobacter nonamiensis]|uniref:glycine cleavage T C-terminal barrel domain-containing protein n=1 Tax=Ilumatobacter nonamiensis TaxID=467093 RepID=UPI00034915D1|nr:glycine cleavage T C-terminal barrel domain-containing protein [Ilumatobacter nonamiensis]